MKQVLQTLVIASLVVGCAQELPAGPIEVAATAQALAPANDRCDAPQVLTLGTRVTGTTFEASNDFNCYFSWGPDVVYSFTPTSSGAFRAVAATPDGGSFGNVCVDGGCFYPFQPTVYLMGPTCDAGTCANYPGTSATNFRATSGATAFIVVDTIGASLGGAFSLLVSPLVPAANDTCATPAVLPLGTTVSVDFSAAIDDSFGPDGGCGYVPFPDVVYSFTPPTSGRYRFTATNGALSLSQGTCGTSCTAPNSVSVADLVAGTPIFLIVDGATAAVTLRVDPVIVPPNDVCANAVPLALATPVQGTTTGASLDVECNSFYRGPDVYYRFTPPTSGAYRVTATTPSTDGGSNTFSIGIGPGSCASDAGATTCFDPFSSQGAAFRGTANTPVTISVATPYGEWPFQVVVNAISTPANDTCASPTQLSAGVPVAVSLIDALDDFGGGGFDAGVSACGNAGVPDVVFSFLPSTTGRYRFQTPFETFLSTGTCGTGCTRRAFGSFDVDLTAGVTAFFVVETSYPQSGSIRVDPIVVPPNDLCVNALPVTPGVVVSGTTVGAGPDSVCSQGTDVFYRFAPATTGAYSARLTTLDGGYGLVALARSCTAGGLDGGGGFSACESNYSPQLNFRAVANDVLNVVVSTRSEGSGFQLVLDAITPPVNDTCASPLALTAGTPVNVSFANAFDDAFPVVDAGVTPTLPDGGFVSTGDGGANVDAGLIARCGYSEPDLVFSFTPATSGRFDFQGPAWLSLSEGVCGQSCFRFEYGSLIVDLVGGRTYWLIAEGQTSMTGVVRVDPLVIPANDRCEAPQVVTAGVAVTGTTRGAGDDFRCGFGGYGPDVVYQFTPSASGVYRASAVDGGGASWRTASCDGGCLASTPTVRATGGTPYFVVVESSYPGSAFELRVDSVAAQSNDTCSSPLPLTLDTPVTANFRDAVDDLPGALGADGGLLGGDGGATCGYSGYADLSFSFTAPSADTYVLRTGNSLISSSSSCGVSCGFLSYGSTFVSLATGQTVFFVVEGLSDFDTISMLRGSSFDGGLFGQDGGFAPPTDGGAGTGGGSAGGGSAAAGGAAGGGSAGGGSPTDAGSSTGGGSAGGGAATAGGAAAGGAAAGGAAAGGAAAGGAAAGGAAAGGAAAGGAAAGGAAAGGAAAGGAAAGGTSTAGGAAAAGGSARGGEPSGSGCGCSTTDPTAALFAAFLLLSLMRRRRL